MFPIIRSTWALLIGIFFLMIGHGIQGPLLAIRGKLEGFGPDIMALVMSGYFLGLLLGSRVTIRLIEKVGHVRVFAALASLISASLLRLIIGSEPATVLGGNSGVSFICGTLSPVNMASFATHEPLISNESHGTILSSSTSSSKLSLIRLVDE